MDNYRNLLQELMDAIDSGIPADRIRNSPLAVRVDAALEQPEPEPVRPPDEELWEMYQGVGTFSPVEFAHDVLARWGRPASTEAVPAGRELTDIALSMLGTIERTKLFIPEITDTIHKALELGRPAPPAEGEVAELVAWLRNMAEAGLGGLDELNADRVADLLEQRHAAPVPVAVSERLPEPGDCDAKHYCWRWNTIGRLWARQPLARSWYEFESHWLPAHTLPLPSGEVQP